MVTARVQPVGSKPRWRGRGGGNAVLLPDQSDPQANHTFSKRGFMGGLTPQQEVLERSGRRCCLCFGLYGNLSCKRGQIAHLDHNHQNNTVDNLAFLCLEHHDEYDTCTSQSKGWTIKEAKLYRDMLYKEIEKLRDNAKKSTAPITHRYEIPLFGRIYSMSRMVLDAVDKNTSQKYYGIQAYPLIYGFHFTFDVTNPNQLDMRILRLYVDVIKFMDADIIGVWEGDSGGAMIVREFGCEIEPNVGRYNCHQISEGFDYIKLSAGEMETFRINVGVVKEGIYRLRLGMEYSTGGETRTIESDGDILEVGVFDPVFHEPSYNWDDRIIQASGST